MALPGYRPENADGIIERSCGCRSDKAQDQIDGRISDPFEGELPTQVQSAPVFQRYPLLCGAVARPLPPADTIASARRILE
jgi:hypothetical protein